MKNTFQLAMGVCCCLQIFNSVLSILVMELVRGQSLMVIFNLLLCNPLG